MRRLLPLLVTLLSTVLLLATLNAGDAAKFPAKGSILPGSIQAFNINGKKGKDRFHCLVCEFGLDPVVLVFAKEGPDGDDPNLKAFLQKLDESVERHQESYLHSFVVVLSPSAKNSVSEEKIEDAGELVKEAQNREKLTKRLTKLAEDLKHVVVSYFPHEGPKGYNLSAEPGVTVILYAKHRVIESHIVAHGKLQDNEIERILKRVDAMIQSKATSGKK